MAVPRENPWEGTGRGMGRGDSAERSLGISPGQFSTRGFRQELRSAATGRIDLAEEGFVESDADAFDLAWPCNRDEEHSDRCRIALRGDCFQGCRADRKQSLNRNFVPETITRGGSVLSCAPVQRVVFEGKRAVGGSGDVGGGMDRQQRTNSPRVAIDARDRALVPGQVAGHRKSRGMLGIYRCAFGSEGRSVLGQQQHIARLHGEWHASCLPRWCPRRRERGAYGPSRYLLLCRRQDRL